MKKYTPVAHVEIANRRWPTRTITKPPIWCSVDLRDGNQALIDPMSVEDKLEMFTYLTRIGFKEIEVGFPSASDTEFATTRALIEKELIPDDVYIQTLTLAREDNIRRTFEAIEGAKHVIFHYYTNVSDQFRKAVYKTTKKGLTDMATRYIPLMKELASSREDKGEGVIFEYSPEMFSESDLNITMSIINEVVDAFAPDEKHKLIINLPSTVQKTIASEFADRIEYVDRHIISRQYVILSVHPHNDRGTGVADAELSQLAGAERIEGTLFGNGERTGNVDIVTLALNLSSMGIRPNLDFKQLNRVKQIYERLTKMQVPQRHPYAGDLVFTAFSGTHQDAIRKGFAYRSEHPSQPWQVPYLVIDPGDIGRSYEPIIRINSQSGKGGAAFVLSNRYGYNLPSGMHAEFGALVKKEADRYGMELPPERLLHLFLREYNGANEPFKLLSHQIKESGTQGNSTVEFAGEVSNGKEVHWLEGEGNGPIDAFFSAMAKEHIGGFTFASYHEHAIGSGSDAKACAYIELKYKDQSVFGVGIHSNVNIASIKGVICAINRALNADK